MDLENGATPGLGLGPWKHEVSSLKSLRGCMSWRKDWTRDGTGEGEKLFVRRQRM